VTYAEKGGGGGSRTVVSALEQFPSAHCHLCVQVASEDNFQVLSHHRYSPNIPYADFVLFPKVKDHLDDFTLIQDSLKSTWEQAIRTLNTAAAAYHR
jgi:hypothetical protein